jgi:hypothetical protein
MQNHQQLYNFVLGFGFAIGVILLALEYVCFRQVRKQQTPTWTTYGYNVFGRWAGILIVFCGLQYFFKEIFPDRNPLLAETTEAVLETIIKAVKPVYQYCNYRAEINIFADTTSNGCFKAREKVSFWVRNKTGDELQYRVPTRYTMFQNPCETVDSIEYDIKRAGSLAASHYGPFAKSADGYVSKIDIPIPPHDSISITKVSVLTFDRKGGEITKTVSYPSDNFTFEVTVPHLLLPEWFIYHPLRDIRPSVDVTPNKDTTNVMIQINAGLLSGMGARVSFRPRSK